MARRAETPIKRRTIKAKERSVLEMTAKQARVFFLKPESYSSVELHAYFQFGNSARRPAELRRNTRSMEQARGIERGASRMTQQPRRLDRATNLREGKLGGHCGQSGQVGGGVLR